MTDVWEERRLSDVCEIMPPKSSARSAVDEDALVSFVPMEDLSANEKHFTPQRTAPLRDLIGSYTYFANNDVLLAKITPCFENGKLGIAKDLSNGIGFGSSEYTVLRPSARLTPDFLYYFLSRRNFREQGARVMSGAVGHKRLPKEFIASSLIPLPPLPEQQRIVGILDKAFENIAIAKANTEKNIANARELSDTELNSIFQDNGDGWVVRPLGQVSGFEGGSQPPKALFVHHSRKGYVRFLQIRDFKTDKHITFIPVGPKNRLCVETDILIARYGASVGQIHTGKAGAYNVALVKTVPDIKTVHPLFFRYYLLSATFQDALKRVASRSAQNGFGKEDIADFDVPLPPLRDQLSIVARLDNLFEMATALEDRYLRRQSHLDELKQSLLHAAFNGEL